MVQGSVPESLRSLFWDVDLGAIRLPDHADYVIERVMTRGTWNAMSWLRRTFDASELRDFLARKGARLPARERAYWQLLLGVRAAQQRGGGRPSWAGP